MSHLKGQHCISSLCAFELSNLMNFLHIDVVFFSFFAVTKVKQMLHDWF